MTSLRVLAAVLMLVLLPGAARRRVPTLKQSIDAEMDASPGMASGFIGMQVVRLSDGKVLYERNQDRLFVPASNAKLFSTALALLRLGPDYRFVTPVLRTPKGDLILLGRGDPSLSGRVYPYAKDAQKDDPLKPIEELADRLVAGGLKSVAGDIVGDDTRYPWNPYPAGWNIGDAVWEYGAPVSALVVNDNRVDVTVTPGNEEGGLAQVAISPPFEFFTIQNNVVTVGNGRARVHVEGLAGISEIRLRGTIPRDSPGDTNSLAVGDPALYGASVLREALIRRGVSVRGRATARHRLLEEDAAPPGGETELAKHVSPPLLQLLQVVDKVSQNLHAEILLREVGAVKRNLGTAEEGLREMDDLLAAAKIEEDEVRLVDGSGLSRGALVSPAAIVKLLVYMYRSPLREQWMSLLPIGGEDGSLRKRFRGHPEAKAIHAKTGSLSHVRALSGYAETRRHGEVAFSLMLNNYVGSDSDVSAFLDNIGLRLLL